MHGYKVTETLSFIDTEFARCRYFGRSWVIMQVLPVTSLLHHEPPDKVEMKSQKKNENSNLRNIHSLHKAFRMHSLQSPSLIKSPTFFLPPNRKRKKSKKENILFKLT